jgi:hypothetical protein
MLGEEYKLFQVRIVKYKLFFLEQRNSIWREPLTETRVWVRVADRCKENQTASIVLSFSAVVFAAVLGEELLVSYTVGCRVFLLPHFVVQEDVEDEVVSITVN